MDYQALKSEIQNDPAGLGYQAHVEAGRTGAIADLLNSADPGGAVFYEELTSRALLRIAAERGLITPLEEDAADASSATQDISKAALKIIDRPDPTLNFDEPGDEQLVQALVGSGVMTQEDMDAIKAEAERPATRAEAVLGKGTTVTHRDVRRALSL